MRIGALSEPEKLALCMARYAAPHRLATARESATEREQITARDPRGRYSQRVRRNASDGAAVACEARADEFRHIAVAAPTEEFHDGDELDRGHASYPARASPSAV